MKFSRQILSTDKKGAKLSWWEYWVGHCWMTGWYSMYNNFRTWMDLVWFEDNQIDYALLKDDDPFEQCYLCFWYDLNDDDTYSKEFLEHLMELAEDAMENSDKLIPLSHDLMDKIQDLVGDLINSEGLDSEMNEILHENLWDLYEGDDTETGTDSP